MSNDLVGYGRPPNSGQFQKGRSGNPKGRPKSTSFRNDLLEELRATVEVVGATGAVTRVSNQRALLKMLMAAALKNEKSAIAALVSFMKLCGVGNEEVADDEILNPDHLQMLKEFLARAESTADAGGGFGSSSDTDPEIKT